MISLPITLCFALYGILALDQPAPISLLETLRVGPQSDERFTWSGAKLAVDVDHLGRIFVTDPDSSRIMVLSPEGKFLKQLGKKGQGPGEFEALRAFQVSVNGRAVAFENLQKLSNISYFDQQLNFVEKKRLEPSGFTLRDLTYAPNGKQAACLLTSPDSVTHSVNNRYAILDEKFSVVLEISQISLPDFDQGKLEDPNYWATYMSHRFRTAARGTQAFMCFDQQSNAYTSLSGVYKVTKYSASGKQVMKIQRNVKPILWNDKSWEAMVDDYHQTMTARLSPEYQQIVTRSVVEKAVKLANFPPYKNPIMGLTPLPNQGLLVIRDIDENGLGLADVFLPDGSYAGVIHHPRSGLRTMVFRGSDAYCLEIDPAGEVELVRYKVVSHQAKKQ